MIDDIPGVPVLAGNGIPSRTRRRDAERSTRIKLWRQINVGAAAALLVLVAACAAVPAVEQSAAPVPSPIFSTATVVDQSQSPSPTATPSTSPSELSATQSTAPTFTASPDSTSAATPLASLTSGSLRVDGLALVVADELRVRSAPGTGTDSTIRGEPLANGREVFVAAGPVRANGYDWWQVQALTGPAHFGWVAAGHDSAVWLAPASVACPRDPSLADLGRLDGARSLVCYGHRDFRIRAYRRPFCGDGIAMANGSPRWIIGVFGGDALYDREVLRDDDVTALEIYGRAHPSLLESGSEYLSCGDKGTGWFDVTGHFDDPVSSQCRYSYYDPTTDENVEEEPALAVTWCRETFVFTEIRPASGP